MWNAYVLDLPPGLSVRFIFNVEDLAIYRGYHTNEHFEEHIPTLPSTCLQLHVVDILDD